jgi:hypothetical protein
VKFPADTVTKYLAADPILAPATQYAEWGAVLQEAREYIAQMNAEAAAAAAPESKPN